jgi:hypothetical protein
MSEQKTVTINGKVYDAKTGKPVANATQPNPRVINSNLVHKKTQKSTTLNRKYISKPQAKTAKMQQLQKRRAATAKPMDFVAHKKPVVQPIKPVADPAPPQAATKPADVTAPHPKLAKVNAIQAHQNTDKRHLTAVEMKNRAISEAFAKISEAAAPTKKTRKTKKQRKLVSILSMSGAIVLIVAYFTYLNLPNISVRIAAMQSGVAVTYPSYRPSGYNLSGLVSFNGENVEMKFASLSGSYKIAQTKSSWDSNAVLRNYVGAKWGNDYSINKGRGLTVYIHEGQAAWVNGGVFYTISATSDLSSDQIEKIAVSL